MSSPSKSYRVYGYDAAYKILTVEYVDAASDEEAIAKAQAASLGSQCEIWDGRRLVTQLEADRRQA